MFKCSGRHLGHRAREASATPLRQHHAMSAECFGGSHDRPQIVGIGETVKGQKERRLLQCGATFHQILQIQSVGRSRLQSNALVHSATSHLSQTCPGDFLHQHSRRFRIAQQRHEFGSAPHLTGAPDAMDGPTGFQCRLGGMTPPEQIIRDTL